MSRSDVLPEHERLAWKFLPYGLRRGQPITDGSVPLIKPGKPVRLDDWQEMREPYLYASDIALAALRDSTGLIVVRVRLLGTILRRHRSRKLYATEYEVLWWGDPTRMLNEYACDLAERALQAGRAMGYEAAPALWAAVAMKRVWLAGKLDRATVQQQATHLLQAYWEMVRTEAPDAWHLVGARVPQGLTRAVATVAQPDATFKAMESDCFGAFYELQRVKERSWSDFVNMIFREVEQLRTDAFGGSTR